MDDEGVCLLRIFERVLRNLRRRRCGRMVGRDGRNLLRVKKRCVDSLSSAPPRAKYLLLLMSAKSWESTEAETEADEECAAGCKYSSKQNRTEAGHQSSRVESRNNANVEREREKSQAHDPGVLRPTTLGCSASYEVTIDFGFWRSTLSASGATAARPNPVSVLISNSHPIIPPQTSMLACTLPPQHLQQTLFCSISLCPYL